MPHSSDYHDPRRANGHRRRLLFNRVLKEESTCWLCGNPVNKELRGIYVYDQKSKKMHLHPDSPSLDEIVPVSQGGDPLDRNNVRLAHLRCNEQRGDENADSYRHRQHIYESKQAERIRHSRNW